MKKPSALFPTEYLCIGGPYHLEKRSCQPYSDTYEVQEPEFDGYLVDAFGMFHSVANAVRRVYRVQKLGFKYDGKPYVLPVLAYEDIDTSTDLSAVFDPLDMELLLTHVVMGGDRDFQALKIQGSGRQPDVFDEFFEKQRKESGILYIPDTAKPPLSIFEEDE